MRKHSFEFHRYVSAVLIAVIVLGSSFTTKQATPMSDKQSIMAVPNLVTGDWENSQAVLYRNLNPNSKTTGFNERNSAYPKTYFVEIKKPMEAPADLSDDSSSTISSSTSVATSTVSTIIFTSTTDVGEQLDQFELSTSTEQPEEPMILDPSTIIESITTGTIDEVTDDVTTSTEEQVGFLNNIFKKFRDFFAPKAYATQTTDVVEFVVSSTPIVSTSIIQVEPDHVSTGTVSAELPTSTGVIIVPIGTPEVIDDTTTIETVITTTSTWIPPIDIDIPTTSPIETVNSSTTATSSIMITTSTTSTLEFSTTTVSSTLVSSSTTSTIKKNIEKSKVSRVMQAEDQGMSLVVGEFNIIKKPSGTEQDSKLENVYLGISFANEIGNARQVIIISYGDGNNWTKLVSMPLNELRSNSENQGYYYFSLPYIENVAQLKTQKIKITYKQSFNEPASPIFVDAVWIESQVVRQIEQQNITLASNKKDFNLREDVNLTFSYSQKELGIDSFIRKIKQYFNGKKNIVKQDFFVRAYVRNVKGRIINNLKPTIKLGSDGKFDVNISKKAYKLPAGKYAVEVNVYEGGKVMSYQQEITWGLMAFNSNKAVYQPGEVAYLQMAVLDEQGHTVCDANLNLEIIQPNGVNQPLVVEKSGQCGMDNITDVPDYFAYYPIDILGQYGVVLTDIKNDRSITDSFSVKDQVDFVIERVGPTRIYPPADYVMEVKIKPNKDFIGNLIEMVPHGFVIKELIITQAGSEITLQDIEIKTGVHADKVTAEVDWDVGQEYSLSYKFNAPDISPYLFLLGPLELHSNKNKKKIRKDIIQAKETPIIMASSTASSTLDIADTMATTSVMVQPIVKVENSSSQQFEGSYIEERSWQIASDAIDYMDPNGDGSNTCAPTPSGDLYSTVDDVIRQPTAGETADYITCDYDQYSFFTLTDLSNVATTTEIQVWVYHQSGVDMNLEVDLWNSAESSQYDITRYINYSDETTKWESVTFSGLSLTQAQTNDLKVKFTYTSTSTSNLSELYSVYASATYDPVNSAPTVASVSLNGGSDIILAEANTTTISAVAVVSDADGYADIQTVTAKVYRSGASGGEQCSVDENNCYEIESCVLSGCLDNSCTATCSADIQFYADPTDTDTPWTAEYWRAWVEAEDSLPQSDSAYSPANSPDILSLSALELDATTISFGGGIPGYQDTTLNKTTTVSTTGNTSLDLILSGTDLLNCNGTGDVPKFVVDEAQADFDSGTYSDTQWDSGNSWLELSPSGQSVGGGAFTSQVFDTGNKFTAWKYLQWTPQRPMYKELPDNGGIETAYSQGNMDMTGNVLLLHLDDGASSVSFSDGSGNNAVGVCYDIDTTCPTYASGGKLNGTFDFDGDNDYIEISQEDNLDFTTNYSLSAWIYPDQIRNYELLFSRTLTDTDDIEVFLRTDGLVALHNRNNGGTLSYVDGWTNPVTEQWSHLVITWGDNIWKLYINGTQVNTSTSKLDPLDTNLDWLVGSSNHSTFGPTKEFDGKIDEVAFFNRTLSATEVNNMYKRGANRVEYQVRSCDDVECSGESFMGPDGTGNTYYSELSDNSIDLPYLGLTNISNNRYFQYQANLETDDGMLSPEIDNITVNYCNISAIGLTDNDQTDFDNGVYTNTQWSSTSSWLELSSSGQTSASGTFTSDIKDSGTAGKPWVSFEWQSLYPMYKELPNNGQIESGYSQGNMDMTGNVLLLHLNDGVSSTVFVDDSGYNNNGSCSYDNNTCPGYQIDHLLLNGHYFFTGWNTTTYHQINVANDASLDFTSEYTLSAWIWANSHINYNFIFNRGAGDADDIEFYGRTSDYISLHNRGNGGISYYKLWPKPEPIHTWILVTLVWQNQNWSLYYNGVSQTALATYGTVSNPLDTNKKWIIGSSEHSTFTYDDEEQGWHYRPYFNGRIEEVAMFDRALTQSEISAIHKRGANKLRYQVRSCDDIDCLGESFIGPGGTASTYYSELYNKSARPPLLDLINLSDNRYFQYKANLQITTSTYVPNLTPEIRSITAGYYGASSTVPVGNIHYALATNTSYDNGTALLVSPGASVNINIPKTTSSSLLQSGTIWWGLEIPFPGKTGSYTNIIDINGVKNDLSWP
ncbi:MAG: LamG-like jellyroll fold domain-containing protein [bacterium]